MSGVAAFLYASCAGLAISVLDYTALHKTPKIERPATFSDPPYLAKFCGHPLIGGFLAFAMHQSWDELTPVAAVSIGAAAPSIWRTLVRAVVGMQQGLISEFSALDEDSSD